MKRVLIEVKDGTNYVADNPDGVPVVTNEKADEVLIFNDEKHYFGLHTGYDNLVEKYKQDKQIVYLEAEFGKVKVVHSPADVEVVVSYLENTGLE